MKNEAPKPATILAQADHCIDATTGAVTPPFIAATTFARDADYAPRLPGVTYSRDGNPTYRQAEQVLAKLEGAADAMLVPSGIAVGSTLLRSLSAGDHLVIPRVMYNGLREWMHRFSNRWGLAFSEFDPTAPTALEAAIRPGETKLVLIETPCNPTRDVTDIAAAAALAHSVGAKLAIDSTVATPLLTRPIEVGADYVMHSATKYLNGHSDVVAGALAAAAEDELWVKTRESRSLDGAILGPFEAWLVLRGMRTMHLRVQQFSASAMCIASQFSAYPKIERVLYPGLADHPGHEIAKRQMRGRYGGTMSIKVAGGRDVALRVAKAVRLFIPATSKACWNIAQPLKRLTVRFLIIVCASVSVSKMSAILLQISNRH